MVLCATKTRDCLDKNPGLVKPRWFFLTLSVGLTEIVTYAAIIPVPSMQIFHLLKWLAQVKIFLSSILLSSRFKKKKTETTSIDNFLSASVLLSNIINH
jgi:hypothetical protein